jgi:hypothetical protein
MLFFLAAWGRGFASVLSLRTAHKTPSEFCTLAQKKAARARGYHVFGV